MGRSSRVWLVEEERTGVSRALKVFPGPQDDEEQLAQLNRESTVLGTLDHPHLLGVHGVVSTDQGSAILMEYAGGGSLLNLVTARGRLSVGECITVLAPVAQALAHLHAASVQHGDVSPGNVLFTAEGKPLLADLGVGRLLGEGNVRAAGTPGFGEETHKEGQAAGFASDVFSLGAIGWYSLTGSPPGRARDRAPLSLLVPDVPLDLLHILEAGLHEDSEVRPSAAEVAEVVLRSAAPQPLDLVAAVHPSVLPELLTRRAAANKVESPRRGLSVVFERFRSSSPASRRVEPRPQPREAGRRRVRTPRQPRIHRSAAVPRVVAALLVLCGAVLVGPYLLKATGVTTGGSAQESVAVEEVTGAKSGSAGQAPGMELSAEMQERLGDADPVKALSALITVRAMVLTTGNTGLLSHVNVSESAAMEADQKLLAGLNERGHVFNGLSIRLQEAVRTDLITVPADATAVSATVIMSGYTEVDSAGATVRQVTDSTPQELVFVLVKQEEAWKIAGVHNEGGV